MAISSVSKTAKAASEAATKQASIDIEEAERHMQQVKAIAFLMATNNIVDRQARDAASAIMDITSRALAILRGEAGDDD